MHSERILKKIRSRILRNTITIGKEPNCVKVINNLMSTLTLLIDLPDDDEVIDKEEAKAVYFEAFHTNEFAEEIIDLLITHSGSNLVYKQLRDKEYSKIGLHLARYILLKAMKVHTDADDFDSTLEDPIQAIDMAKTAMTKVYHQCKANRDQTMSLLTSLRICRGLSIFLYREFPLLADTFATIIDELYPDFKDKEIRYDKSPNPFFLVKYCMLLDKIRFTLIKETCEN